MGLLQPVRDGIEAGLGVDVLLVEAPPSPSLDYTAAVSLSRQAFQP